MNQPSKIVTQGQDGVEYVRQHLIDPELCLACGSCMAVCTEGAVFTNDHMYPYVIDPDKCTNGHECLEVCGSDAIKSWHMVPADKPYSVEQQLAWEALPAEIEFDGETLSAALDDDEVPQGHPAPATAAKPITLRYTQKAPLSVVVKSNIRVTDPTSDTDVHHIVLDFSGTDFQWLEGQNVGVMPPGTDTSGHGHHMRAYSIASSREGEVPGTGEMALTIKRVVDEWQGKPYRGVASNFMCDLQPGDRVNCVGPIGEHFLMPQSSDSRILMICSGTGIAPMRSFIQQQQRLSVSPKAPLQLFYGGRTQAEMAYTDELLALPGSLLNTHLALSRSPQQPKRYVQDLLRQESDLIADFLRNENSHIFICGMIAMGQEVMQVLATIASEIGLSWEQLHHDLLHSGRLQIETY